MKTLIAINKNSRAAIKFAALGVKRSNLPILGNVHLYANGSLEMVGTDLDVFTVSRCACASEIDGKVTFPAAALKDVAAIKADGNISLSADAKSIVTISANGNERKIYGLPATDFPALPELGEKIYTASFPAAKFISALKSVSLAMSTDASRYVLNGVCVEISADNVRLVATDGRRLQFVDIARGESDAEMMAAISAAKTEFSIAQLARDAAQTVLAETEKQFPAKPIEIEHRRGRKSSRFEDSEQTKLARENYAQACQKLSEASQALSAIEHGESFIIPAKAVSLIQKFPLDKKADQTIKIELWQELKGVAAGSRFTLGEFSIYSRLVEGNFPNCRQVIPGDCKERITVLAKEFQAVLEAAEKGTSEKHNAVGLFFDKNGLTVKANAPEIGETVVKMPGNFALQNPFCISFNPRYLIEACQSFAVNHAEMVLEFVDELSPVKILSTDGALQVVIMPMRMAGSSPVTVTDEVAPSNEEKAKAVCAEIKGETATEQKPVILNCVANNQPEPVVAVPAVPIAEPVAVAAVETPCPIEYDATINTAKFIGHCQAGERYNNSIITGNFNRKKKAIEFAADNGGKIAGYLHGKYVRGWVVSVPIEKPAESVAAKLENVKPLSPELPEPETPFEVTTQPDVRVTVAGGIVTHYEVLSRAGGIYSRGIILIGTKIEALRAVFEDLTFEVIQAEPMKIETTFAESPAEAVVIKQAAPLVMAIRRDERGQIINGNFPMREASGPVKLPPIPPRKGGALATMLEAGEKLAALMMTKPVPAFIGAEI